ncbi:multicopper oxidase domain-containing protein [Mycobacterium sp.]|uniref:multicopper oxidase domain-containing protein n=1 Tax=Mycobacterium sp. TaxID=1785 RepID=UPI0025DA7C10|nr:multicopper oxidase domain-containing protein [Mycobacterium sp.]
MTGRYRPAMTLGRREFLKLGGAALVGGAAGAEAAPVAACSRKPAPGKADYTVRIGIGLVELAPGRVVSTRLYSGQFPGPLLRFTEGRPVVVDVYNDTDVPEQLHWHGQTLPVDVDGAAEEGTPFIPAHGMRRLAFTPGPSGLRYYHTHLAAGDDLSLGTYNGQVGPVYIEPRHNPGRYDREVFLTLKEFEPYLDRSGAMGTNYLAGAPIPQLRAKGEAAIARAQARGRPPGYDLEYTALAINGRELGHGDPIRVRPGERVLLQLLNASATQTRGLALPGHAFTVIALDGNPVPTRATVPVLWMGAAERISAVVEMNTPGVWVLGDIDEDARRRGMGTVVEYAGHTGPPQWIPPPPFTWDYRLFAAPAGRPAAVDHEFEMMIERKTDAEEGFDVWTINGQPFSTKTGEPRFDVARGKRYRVRVSNAT